MCLRVHYTYIKIHLPSCECERSFSRLRTIHLLYNNTYKDIFTFRL